MRIAVVTSNFFPVSKNTKKGTEIWVKSFIEVLNELKEKNNLEITLFASGDSEVPVKVISVDQEAVVNKKSVMQRDKHIIYELALLSKALTMQNDFDIYHINIGDGDIALPFIPFSKKPIVITVHYSVEAEYVQEYFELYKNLKNLYLVAVSDYQKKTLSNMPFITTIHNGIDLDSFTFDPTGGEDLLWVGRAVPVKGPDIAMKVATETNNNLRLFAITIPEHSEWFKKISDEFSKNQSINIVFDLEREKLIRWYQKSKAFIFPVSYEEAFGLTLLESMACGAPVVAYAKGSIPEIIEDGKTGFIVNSSDEDIRGNWKIKKTGQEGLKEAVGKIYAMSSSEYRLMRRECRKHAEEHFSNVLTTKKYVELFRKIL